MIDAIYQYENQVAGRPFARLAYGFYMGRDMMGRHGYRENGVFSLDGINELERYNHVKRFAKETQRWTVMRYYPVTIEAPI